MLLFLSLPVLVNTDYILHLWLKTVPNYTVIFVQLTLILALVESISYPLITALLSTGIIKKYQILAGGVNLLNLPISYLILRLGVAPYMTLIVAIVIAICCLFIRLWLLRDLLAFPVSSYFRKVITNIIFVAFLSALIPFL